MNTRGLLDQLLSSGKEFLQGQSTTQNNSSTPTGQNSALNGLLGSLGGGALGGGLVSLLMSSKKARKVGGNVVTYGGLAALGVVAYKAYSNWQSQNQAQGQSQSQSHTTSLQQPQTVDRVPSALMEEHSQAILRAIIAAAKADGHIDERERELIDNALSKLTNEAQLHTWFEQELRKPLDPSELAGAAKTPEMGAEMYLASLLVVDEESYMERAYLDELARQLQLAPSLKTELETQARAHLG